jgi:integrase/recombinase XerD
MTEIKFRFELNDKPNREGLNEIFLVISDSIAKQKVRTDVQVKNDHFGIFKDVLTGKGKIINRRVLTAEKWVSNQDKEAAYKNKKLKDLLKEYNEAYDNCKEVEAFIDKDTVIKAVKNKYILIDVISVFERYIKECEIADDYLNKKNFVTAKNHLAGFLKKENKSKIDFRQIDKAWLKKYEKHLYQTIKGKKANGGIPSDSSVHSIVKSLCKIFNYSRDEKIIKKDVYPFGIGGYSLPKIKPQYKERLTQAELTEFQNVYAKLGSVDFNVQNLFMLAVRMAGARVEDMLTLKVKNIHSGRITYNMKKGCTNGELKTILIDKKIQKILDWHITEDSRPEDFIFPFLSPLVDSFTKTEYKKEIGRKTTLVNNSLKKIAKKAGISKSLSSHIARHSFASIAQKTTNDVNVVRELLGHKDLSTTLGYLAALNIERQDEVMESIII